MQLIQSMQSKRTGPTRPATGLAGRSHPGVDAVAAGSGPGTPAERESGRRPVRSSDQSVVGDGSTPVDTARPSGARSTCGVGSRVPRAPQSYRSAYCPPDGDDRARCRSQKRSHCAMTVSSRGMCVARILSKDGSGIHFVAGSCSKIVSSGLCPIIFRGRTVERDADRSSGSPQRRRGGGRRPATPACGPGTWRPDDGCARGATTTAGRGESRASHSDTLIPAAARTRV